MPCLLPMCQVAISAWRRILVLCAAAVLPAAVYAAPANDAYAAAAMLPSALPVEASGTTVGATTEAGETLPFLTGKTIWWSWTPAATGWVKVTVSGTGIDPVASLFKGTSAAPADRVAWNDDFSNETIEAGLILQVTAGEIYHLQAGGYDGSEGVAVLKLESVSPPPLLTALSSEPMAVDVTSQAGAAVCTLQISHPAGVSFGWLSLFRPNGVEETAVFVDYRSLTSGTAAAGTYQISVPIRHRVMPGAYALRFDVIGTDGNHTIYGERTPFPAGVPHSISVVNNGIVDEQAPIISSLTLSPSSADVTTAGKAVAISVRVVDTLSGMNDFSGHLQVRSPLGETVASGVFSYRTRKAGDNFDGTYLVPFTIPAGAPPGNYPIAVQLVDGLGNRIFFGPNSEGGEVPLPAELPDHLTVVNTGTVDTQAPVLTKVTVSPASVNVAEFQSMTLTVEATDARSGIASVGGEECGLQPVGGGAVVTLYPDLELFAGTAVNGVFKGTVFPPHTLPAGIYRVVGLQLEDALGNSVTHGPTALGFTAYPAGINPLVTITSQPLPGPYQTWIAGYPSLSGIQAMRTADPDGDGLPNLVELALGTDPTLRNAPGSADPNQSHVPGFRREGNRLYMEYTPVPANLGTAQRRIYISPQESGDLISWQGATTLIDGSERIKTFITVTAGQKKWIRLNVYDPAADLGQ